MKTFIVLTFAILAQAVGNVFLTRGMKVAAMPVTNDGGDVTMSAVDQSLDIARRAAQSPEVWAGVVLVIVFFVLCSAALSWADVSFVLPATAAGYVLNVAAGRYFLHEDVTTTRWIGALVIMLGVVFVSRSGERTTPVTPGRAGARAVEGPPS